VLFVMLVAVITEVVEEKNKPVEENKEPVEQVEDEEEVTGEEDFADLDDDELMAALGEHGLDDDDDEDLGDFDFDEHDDLDDSGEAEEEDFSAMPLDKIRKLHQKLDADGDGNASLGELLQFSDKVHKETIKIIVPELVGMLDHIKDGKLSLEEILQDMSDDGESGLTQEELNTWKELETMKFKLADADGDGFLSVEEVEHMFYPETHEGVLKLGIEALIKRRDGDGDGKLSLTEFWGNTTSNETDATESGTESVIPRNYTESEHKTFSKLDKNGDNLLDAEELIAWESGKFHTEETLMELLDLADTNHDGHLTVEEIEEAKANIQKIDATHDLVQWIKHLEL